MNIDATPRLDGVNLLWGLTAGVVTAVVFGVGCFFLVYDSQGYMGWTLFLLVPLVTGFATALVARQRNVVIASLILGLLFCTAILIAIGVEGFVCVIMSAPLIAIGLAIGALLGWGLRVLVISKSKKSATLTLLMLVVLPFFLIAANSAESGSRKTLRAETVTDTLVVSQSPEAVWNELKNMDSVTASKGFLMRIGLPVPVSCKTEGEGIGGKRTC